MTQLVIPFHEAIELAKGARPFPKGLESIRCQGDTIHLTLNPEASLPGFLKAVSPKVKLALQYRSFDDGVARFDLRTSVFSLSATGLIKLLLNLFSLPSLEGIRVEAPKAASQDPPQVLIDLNRLVRQRVEGVEVREFYLLENEFIVMAQIEGFRPVSGRS